MGRLGRIAEREAQGVNGPAVREPHGREEAPDSEGSGAFFLVGLLLAAWVVVFFGWQVAVLLAESF